MVFLALCLSRQDRVKKVFNFRKYFVRRLLKKAVFMEFERNLQ